MAGRRKARETSSSGAGAEEAAASVLQEAVVTVAKRLPQGSQTWLGAQMPLGLSIADTPEGADIAIWMESETGMILGTALGPSGAPELLREALMQAMVQPMSPGPACRPRAVAIDSPALLPQVQDLLKELHVVLAEGADFTMVHNAVNAFVEQMETRLPHPLMTGLTPPELALFCERMADLWKAAPWRTVVDSDMMAIVGLTPEPIYISIMGYLKESFGFVVFLTAEAASAILSDDDSDMASMPCIVASFEGKNEVGSLWPATIQDHGWRLGRKGRYPTVMRLGVQDATPSDDEMRMVTSLASVLAQYPYGNPGRECVEFTVDGRSARAIWPASPSSECRQLAAMPPAPAEKKPKGRSRTATADATPIFQLKISLAGARPPVWRRVQVRASSSLQDLHEVIQAAMAWDDLHLWEFDVAGQRFGEDAKKPSRARLEALGLCEKSRFHYVYDFGDCWELTILVEKILSSDPGATYPRCVAGKRAAPVEDCGGLMGYLSYVDAVADPGHDDHEEAINRLGDDFDPEYFSVDEVNKLLEPVPPRRRSRRD